MDEAGTARSPHARRHGPWPSALLCIALLIALACGLNRWTHGFEVWTFEGRRELQWRAGELRAQPVDLRDSNERAPRLWGAQEGASAAYLVDFVYLRCASVCRALGSEFQRLQGELAAAPPGRPVHLVSISFDVVHDDAGALARYAAEQRADPRLWTLAVPRSADDAQTLLRSLGVIVVPDGEGGYVHNGDIHLLDARGTLRGVFTLDQAEQALQAARRLAGVGPAR